MSWDCLVSVRLHAGIAVGEQRTRLVNYDVARGFSAAFKVCRSVECHMAGVHWVVSQTIGIRHVFSIEKNNAMIMYLVKVD